MRHLILITLFILAGSVIAANAQASAGLTGKFAFTENGGKTAGGIAVFVGHDLTINADGTTALTANGFQTARDLICQAKTVGGKTMIYLTLYNTEGVNSFTPYEIGDLLLTLEQRTVKGKKVIWTTWGKYQPSVISPKKTGGVYFVRAKN